jgi:ectoine hydrolase
MQRRIELGQPTVIEIAGVVKRYHCPLYKTVIHDAPAGLRAVAEVVAEANEAGRRTLRPGVTNGEVFAAVDQVLHARGYAESGISRNGYMVGIAMQPNWVQRYGISIARGGNILLKPGMVFHFLTVLAKPNEYAVGESSTLALIDDGWTDLTPGVEAGPILRGP